MNFWAYFAWLLVVLYSLKPKGTMRHTGELSHSHAKLFAPCNTCIYPCTCLNTSNTHHRHIQVYRIGHMHVYTLCIMGINNIFMWWVSLILCNSFAWTTYFHSFHIRQNCALLYLTIVAPDAHMLLLMHVGLFSSNEFLLFQCFRTSFSIQRDMEIHIHLKGQVSAKEIKHFVITTWYLESTRLAF